VIRGAKPRCTNPIGDDTRLPALTAGGFDRLLRLKLITAAARWCLIHKNTLFFRPIVSVCSWFLRALVVAVAVVGLQTFLSLPSFAVSRPIRRAFRYSRTCSGQACESPPVPDPARRETSAVSRRLLAVYGSFESVPLSPWSLSARSFCLLGRFLH
jgi:hypothetical protein